MRIVIAAGLALLSSLSASALEYDYEEVTGASRSLTVYSADWNAERTACELACVDASGKAWRFSLGGDYATRRCAVTDGDGPALSFIRENDVIRIEGSAKGRELRESLPIDGSPWFEAMEFCLGKFAVGGDKRLDFWIVDPEKRKARKMTAERMGLQSLGADGVSAKAIKVRVTASGVPAIFYSISYWFREADGILLRFEGARGGPGTPKTVQRLTGEK